MKKPTMEEVLEAITWFVENAPVEWDEDDKGCRYCGTFDRSPVPHRKDCGYAKAVRVWAEATTHDQDL